MTPGNRNSTSLLSVLVTAVVLVSACGTSQTEVAVPIARPDRDPPTNSAVSNEATAEEALPTAADRVAVESAVETTDRDRDAGVETESEVVAPTSTTSLSEPTPTTVATTTTLTTLPPPDPPQRDLADPAFGATAAAFERLSRANAAASMTVVRGGDVVFSSASGTSIDGQQATGDSPMVVASVSKIVVAVAIARLHEQGRLDVSAPVPWADIGLDPNVGWYDVTVRELLDHRSGLAKARYSWFTGEGTCREYIPSLLTSPPNGDRGRWVYSNGNYCVLGLLVEQRTGRPLDVALQQLVFDPVGVSGVHLTSGGLQPADLPHPDGVERLSRLGGAGTLIVSTDDTAMAIGRMTPADREILLPPGVFTDQYGFGHTGTIDGAKACIWVLEDGATVVSATIAGNSVSSGGGVCDVVVPAVASDLGFGSARPDRTP